MRNKNITVHFRALRIIQIIDIFKRNSNAVKAGASDEEITESIGVALLMGGGPASIYGCEALKQFRALANS